MSGFTFTCAQRCFIKAQILLQFMLFPVLVAKMMPVIPRSCAKLRSSFLELSGKQNSPVFVFAGNRYFTRSDSTHSKVLQFRHTGSSRANGLQQKPETAVSACRTQKPKILSPFPCTEYYKNCVSCKTQISISFFCLVCYRKCQFPSKVNS